MNPSKQHSAPEDADLSLAWTAHLEQEEAVLVETLDGLRSARSALLRGDLKLLSGVLDGQARTTQKSQDLGQAREELRRRTASFLGSPVESVTLSLLIDRSPGRVAGTLNRFRQRLRGLTGQVDELNRGNAVLVRHSLDFLHDLFQALTAGSGGDRYGPAGLRQRPQCGPLLEARG